MANRLRKNDIHIMVTDEEKELFNKKLEMSKSKSMGHFIRKSVLEAPIFVIDMNIFRRLQTLIGKNSNNLNQIAKRVNSTGVIYREDIEDLKKENDDISREIIKIQNILTRKYMSGLIDMAITKIHPIKSTLNLAIDYITSNDKTDEQILISSDGCSPATAHLQFMNTRETNNTRGTVLARHLIQSFVPGEVSPDKAHEIGLALAKEVLNGEYEYVLATHVDRNHIHNHIIFNNVNWKTGKCYQSNKRSYHKIRSQSDQLCKENNLIVIDEYYEKYKKKYKTRGKSYKEYQERKKGTSWKGRLQFDIDRAIKKAKHWEDFLHLMDQYGYEIKHGKHISFRKIDGQQRFTRAMRIGEDYTEERLKERILEEVEMKIKRPKAPFKPLDNVIDISANDKVKNSPGYKYWATRHNLSTMADTINQVRSEGFKTREQLEKALQEKAAVVQSFLTENKEIEKFIKAKKKIMENRYIIEQYKEIYKYVKAHPEDKAFIDEYNPQLMLYKKAVAESFQDSNILPTTKQIYEDLEKLHEKKSLSLRNSIIHAMSKTGYISIKRTMIII